jgi:hypothetical protein
MAYEVLPCCKYCCMCTSRWHAIEEQEVLARCWRGVAVTLFSPLSSLLSRLSSLNASQIHQGESTQPTHGKTSKARRETRDKATKTRDDESSHPTHGKTSVNSTNTRMPRLESSVPRVKSTNAKSQVN